MRNKNKSLLISVYRILRYGMAKFSSKGIIIIMKSIAIIIIIFGITITGTIAFLQFYQFSKTPSNNTRENQILQITPKVMITPSLSPAQPILRIGEIKIPVEIADTPEKRGRGLSGRLSLPSSSGMLFIFEKPNIHRFWMPNMHFPIDFIWIDSAKRIVGITENAQPLTNLLTPVWYTPPEPVKYVLEVNAGFSRTHNIKVGMEVQLP